jgi:hypothetical protein
MQNADVFCYFMSQQLKALPPGSTGFDASKVKVYGDGVKPSGVLASLPVSFLVDTTQAGVADIEIIIEVVISVDILVFQCAIIAFFLATACFISI